jgi:nucleotide-binding universal stress UspA family protein
VNLKYGVQMNGSFVLVGFDDTATSERALRWGAEEASLRRLPLTVCHAWHWSYPVPPSGPEAVETVRKMGKHILDKGVMIAGEVAPQVQVRARLSSGPASAILVEQSGNAALVLVGAHGRGGFGELAAGSAAVQVPAYAHCPVLVVRNAADRSRPVVVGVDRSPASEAALGFGFEEAALRRQPLIAVHACWEPEAIVSAEMGMVTDPEQLREMAACRLERTVSPWREKYPYVAVETSLVMATPLHALRNVADGAGLLVLGARGVGGAEWLRLGAVSSAMVQHALCSVAIIRSRT